MKSARAKVLHPVLGQPLASYPVGCALALGAAPVVAVVGHQGEAVKAALTGCFPQAPLGFATQAEQKGTGHAVSMAEPALVGFSGDVLILYGDVPLLRRETLEALRRVHAESQGPLSLVGFRPADPTGYGRLVEHQGRLARIVEHRDATPEERELGLCNAGIYLADAGFLWEALRGLRSDNAQGELYLTDIAAAAANAGAAVGVVEATPEEVAGVNDRRELAQAARVLQGRINRAHMAAGVSLLDPGSAWIDAAVRLGEDCELGPNVQLRGATALGRGVVVGAGCVVTDSTLGDGTVLQPYSVLEGAALGARTTIGPFARLRPGTELADEVHLGNFVETKKARIGKGSKAGHLSYLGDATVGAGCNIGAGTITCNYDGVNKHRTALGDGVFIGSDTQLVAPVAVGDGAYVGAGTTVTADVPADALAISRAPQKNVPGWAKKKRALQGSAKS